MNNLPDAGRAEYIKIPTLCHTLETFLILQSFRPGTYSKEEERKKNPSKAEVDSVQPLNY